MKFAIASEAPLGRLSSYHALAVCIVLAVIGLLLWIQLFTSALGQPIERLSGHSWQIAELDGQGRIVRLGSSPFTASLAFGLFVLGATGLAITAFSHSAGCVPRDVTSPGEIAKLVEASGRKLETELAAVLKLISQQLGANKRYASVLTDADVELASPLSVDRIKRIVHFLVAENLKVRTEIDQLQTGFENSKLQIATLRANLCKAQELGFVDGLTSLKNRRWLDENLNAIAAAAAANASPLSFVLADIDHFKRINDCHGHQVGDEVLKKFAELLSTAIRETDVAVRYGGEEFALVLPGKSVGEAWVLGESMRRGLESKQWKQGDAGAPIGKVTASFGISQYREGEDTYELIRRADIQLYAAKSKGRNVTVAEAD